MIKARERGSKKSHVERGQEMKRIRGKLVLRKVLEKATRTGKLSLFAFYSKTVIIRLASLGLKLIERVENVAL